jgi:hypothetical protein
MLVVAMMLVQKLSSFFFLVKISRSSFVNGKRSGPGRLGIP